MRQTSKIQLGLAYHSLAGSLIGRIPFERIAIGYSIVTACKKEVDHFILQDDHDQKDATGRSHITIRLSAVVV